MKTFRFKKALNIATAVSLIGAASLMNPASGTVTFYTADTANATIDMVGLNKTYLGYDTLTQDISSLGAGSNMFKYAAVVFTPTEDGTYSFGQIYSPVDSIMILYNGVYDPTSPGNGALVGNDDTSASVHQASIGDPTAAVYCAYVNYCPQVTYSVAAGTTYTLFVSVYSPGSYNNNFGLPFQFYSTGDVVFGTYTPGRTPIDMAKPFYLASELGVTVDPSFVGGTLKMDQANGVYAEDFTLANMSSNTIDQNGNDTAFNGVFSDAVSGSPGRIVINNTGNGGSVTFNSSNTYTGSTVLKNGTLIVSQDANLGAPQAVLAFDGGTLKNTASFDSERPVVLVSNGTFDVAADTAVKLAGVVAGPGGWSKAGDGTLVLNADNTYNGETRIEAGTLLVGDQDHTGAKLSGGTAVTVADGATLGGYGEITGSVVNDGLMAVGPALAALADGPQANFIVNGNVTNNGKIRLDGKAAGNSLTVNGDYAGNGGELVMNAVLAGDNSLTDKLIISGNAIGRTLVTLNNLGGSGEKTIDGIQLVKVGGVSDGQAFVQNGRIVAGAYDYTLVKGNASGNDSEGWYLTNRYTGPSQETGTTLSDELPPAQARSYNLRPEAGAYIANLAAAANLFNLTLHDRLGETQYTDQLSGEKKVTSVWMRGDYGHNKSRDNSSTLDTTTDRSVVQIGGDLARWNTAGNNRFHLGVMGGYGNSDSDTRGRSGHKANGKVDGYSVGLYGTWYRNSTDKSGPYVDSWVMWNDLNAKVQGAGLKEENYGIKGLNASLEAGYTFKTAQWENVGLWVQPKAQATWIGTNADDHRESNGTLVKGSGNNLQTRVGVRGYLAGSEQNSNAKYSVQPYAELNWIHNDQPYGVTMNGQGIEQNGANNVAEVKAGLESSIGKNTSLWLNVSYQKGSDAYSDTAARAGVKYSF